MSKLKLSLLSSMGAIALEPRLLFDGAGAVGAADAMGDDYTEHEPSSDESGQNDADTNAILNDDELHIPAGASPSVLVIIDSSLEDFQSLLADLPANTVVRVVDSDESGLAAISDELAKGQSFDAVHIFSHGTPGSFTLGSDQVDGNTLNNQAEQLQRWAGSLTEEADILLYGCDIAQGETGQAFITQLATLTGADIAASTNATGAADKGGDWVLESETGLIQAEAFGFEVYGALLGDVGAVAVVDAVDSDPVVGENDKAEAADSTKVLEGWEVSGGATQVTVVVSVEGDKGVLSGPSGLTYTGPASGVDDWLAGIRYEYTGESEVGDEDTITLTVKEDGQTDRVFEQKVIIAAQNDAPTVDLTVANTNYIRLKVDEGGSVSFTAVNKLTNGVGGAELGARQDNLGLYDPDNIAEQIIIKITELPAKGALTLNGVTLTAGATFSLDEIGLLKYTHNGEQVLEKTEESFKISIDDGAGGLLVNQEVFIDILPVNDAPSISGADSIVIIQGEGRVGLAQGGSLPVIGGNRGQL